MTTTIIPDGTQDPPLPPLDQLSTDLVADFVAWVSDGTEPWNGAA